MSYCPNEHTAHKSPDSTEFWITCGDKEIAHATFTQRPETDVVSQWFSSEMDRHRIAVLRGAGLDE